MNHDIAPTNDELPSLFHAARRLAGAAATVRVVAWIIAVVGVIGGIAIATQTDSDGNHPLASLGVGVVVASLMQGAIVSLLAAWADTAAKDRLYFVAVERQRTGG